MEKAISFDKLCPTVREAGMQMNDFWQIPRLIYDYQFMYCLSGNALMTIGNQNHRLSRGHLAIIPPNVKHTLVYEGERSAEIAWMHLDMVKQKDGDWIYRFYSTPDAYVLLFGDKLPFPEHIRKQIVFPGGFRLPKFVVFDDPEKIEGMFRSVIKAFAAEQTYFQLLSRTVALQLIDAILTQCGYWQSSGKPILVSDIMKQYIHSNYMKKITLKDIGECTSYNPDYASKLFRRETGKTVVEYINQYRITKAKTMLLDPSLPITEIATRCGFQSVNYFSSVCRQFTGKSPRALRTYYLTIMDEVPLS